MFRLRRDSFGPIPCTPSFPFLPFTPSIPFTPSPLTSRFPDFRYSPLASPTDSFFLDAQQWTYLNDDAELDENDPDWDPRRPHIFFHGSWTADIPASFIFLSEDSDGDRRVQVRAYPPHPRSAEYRRMMEPVNVSRTERSLWQRMMAASLCYGASTLLCWAWSSASSFSGAATSLNDAPFKSAIISDQRLTREYCND